MSFNLTGEATTLYGVTISMEGGTISNGIDSYDSASFSVYSRSTLFSKTNGATTAIVDMSVLSQTSVNVSFYGADRVYLLTLNVEKRNGVATVAIPSNAEYVRFQLAGTVEQLSVSFNAITKQVKRVAQYSPTERFTFRVDGNICTTGRMLLPPNYDPDGDPVPLVVFMHGSGNFNTWTDEMTGLTYKQYIADEGFAIIDIFGWTSKYASKYSNLNGADPYPIPLHIQAHKSAVEYVCTCYNIDADHVHIMSKSQGGQLAFHCATFEPFRVRSIGMFAPVLDYLSMNGEAWLGNSRKALADELGFVGDIDDYYGKNTYSSACVAYLEANIEKLNTLNEAWQGLIGPTLGEKFETSIENGSKFWQNKSRTDIYQDLDLIKIAKVPFTIWGAPDDVDTPYLKMAEAVAQVNNGGCEAHLVTLPTGCGGHSATDSGATTHAEVRQSNVTTALGVHYDYVPLAYYQNVQWMRLKAI